MKHGTSTLLHLPFKYWHISNAVIRIDLGTALRFRSPPHWHTYSTLVFEMLKAVFPSSTHSISDYGRSSSNRICQFLTLYLRSYPEHEDTVPVACFHGILVYQGVCSVCNDHFLCPGLLGKLQSRHSLKDQCTF